MQYTILIDRQEDTQKIELQEQARFIKSILESLEIPIEFDPDSELSVGQKQKFKKDLEQFHLKIISSTDNSIKIFVDQDVIGEWFKPNYKLKQDFSQVDPRKKLFLEMSINFWSIFEEDTM